MNSLSDRSARALTVVRPVRWSAEGSGGSSPVHISAPTSGFSRHRFDDELRDGGFLADAAAHADRAAWSAGYEAGMEEGIACGRALSAVEQAAADRRAQGLLERVAAAADRVVDEQKGQAAAAANALLRAAFEIAKAIVGREVSEHPRSGEEALLAVLRLAPEHMPCIARLNPADVEQLGDISERFVGRDITIVADATVAAGDCVVTLPTGRIEHRIDDAVARVRRVVLGQTPDDNETRDELR